MPNPGACGYPDATNTGTTGALTPVTGNVTLSTPGQVYADKDVAGCITVTAANVTITNVKTTCNQFFNLFVSSGSATITNVTVSCNDNPGVSGITGDNYTATAINVHDCENGFDAGHDVTIQDSYCHDLRGGDNDCVQGSMDARVTIQHNTFVVGTTYPDNSAIEAAGAPDYPSKVSLHISNNLMVGGNFTLYCPRKIGRASCRERV